MAADCIPFFRPGQDLPAHATVALTGKRFCMISGNIQSGPGLSATAEGSNYRIAKPAAGGRVLGVLSRSAASGEKVKVLIGGINPVTCAANLTAGAEVEVDSEGRVIPLAGGIAVGMAMSAATSGADAIIFCYGFSTTGGAGSGVTPTAAPADLAVTDPADTPASADALRDDIVANAFPSIEAKVNALIDALQAAGVLT